MMLNEKERLFVEYWELNREKEKGIGYQLLRGLPAGMLFALPILLILLTGRYWYKRADMVANSQMNIGVLVVAVMGITVFVALLYKRHQWDMKEQQFLELKAKAKAQKS